MTFAAQEIDGRVHDTRPHPRNEGPRGVPHMALEVNGEKALLHDVLKFAYVTPVLQQAIPFTLIYRPPNKRLFYVPDGILVFIPEQISGLF